MTGWLGQGGKKTESGLKRHIVFTVPMNDTSCPVLTTIGLGAGGGAVTIGLHAKNTTDAIMHAACSSGGSDGVASLNFEWHMRTG